MELENLRQQEPGSNDPFQGNRWFRIAVIALGALAVVGVLVFLLIFLGFCAPNRQTTANPTPKPPATAVVVVVTETAVVAASPTSAPATATRVLEATTAATANAQPTTAAAPATEASAQTTTPAAEPSITTQPTRAALATRAPRTPLADTGERPGALGRLYIGALRYDPPNPVRNNPVNFSVTMLNLTGQEQNYPLCVEIYLPDKAKPLGTTDCNNVTISTGASQVPVGFWIGSGIKQCIQLRARAVMKEQGGEARVPLTTQKGEELWTDFGVCP